MRNRSNTKDIFDQLIEESEMGEAPAQPDTADEATAESDACEDAAAESDAVQDDSEDSGTDTADTDCADADDRNPEPARGKRLLPRLLLGLGVAVLIAAIGLAGFFGWQAKQQNDVNAAGQAALGVARDYAVLLTSVDYQKLDDNFNQVLNGATGEFKDMYSQSAAQLRQLLIENKAVSHGTVVDSAIKSAAKDKVEVLIFIDQSISNSVNPEPRIDRSRVGITMSLVDNRWLASKVDIK